MSNIAKENNKQDAVFEKIMLEIQSGVWVKDILPNAAVRFAEEHEAMYFANARKNLQSDMADAVINVSQDLNALKILENIKE